MKTRAQSLLGKVPLGADPELDSLVMQLANRAHEARASRTLAQYKEPWRDLLAWAEQKQPAGADIYNVLPEVVAMYLMCVFMTVEADDVGHGRVATASAAIACHFFLAGRPSPTDHPTCTLVCEISKQTLRPNKLQRVSMQPDHVRALVTRFAGPDALLPDLMIVVCVVIMFTGFLRFSDIVQVSVRQDLLVISPTHMTLDIPKSKTDQEGLGHTTRIARIGGPVCPVALTERLLTLGAYIRIPRSPAEDVGPSS